MKTVVIFSGGLDSTTMLYALRDQGHELRCIGFDYGQRHRIELQAAESIAKTAGVPYQGIDLSALGPVIAGQSSQVNPDVEVPDGHYNEESMKATVVPNRNMIMLSVAVAHAISVDFDAVAYGAHAGDHTIYPDCREVFVDAMRSVIGLCDWKQVELLTPYLHKNKSEIVLEGAKLEVPFGETWSCYKGGDIQCGTCGTCVERKEAFTLAKVSDPTQYLV
ncbi:MAG: 7-cyano-7-deazaguanine synthase QueC [Kofleriaceae bacterium]|nr:7-cyano-7-deazaguanine synthase QueC [Kofleriaceae bacterium]